MYQFQNLENFDKPHFGYLLIKGIYVICWNQRFIEILINQ